MSPRMSASTVNEIAPPRRETLAGAAVVMAEAGARSLLAAAFGGYHDGEQTSPGAPGWSHIPMKEGIDSRRFRLDGIVRGNIGVPQAVEAYGDER